MAANRGTVMINVVSAADLISADSNGKSDPYVIVQVGEKGKKAKTKIQKKTLNPVWREEFKLPVTTLDKIVFTVKDWDRFSADDPLGTAEVNVETLLTPANTSYPLTLPLQGVDSGKLTVEMMFVEQGLETEFKDLSHTKFFKSVNSKLERDYICKADPDGITLYLFANDYTRFAGITKSAQVKEIFTENVPYGSTNLTDVLKAAFTEHFAQKGKQTTILVVTDGAPDQEDTVKEEIRKAAACVENDEDLSITFVQIGPDPSATEFLRELDENLNARFDIVDTVTAEEMKGMNFQELITKSITD